MAVLAAVFVLASCKPSPDLPRGKADPALAGAFDAYVTAVDSIGEEIHSIMIVKKGRVVAEKWFGDHTPDEPHGLWSVSKTFTSMAVGLAVDAGLVRLDDRVMDFFPDQVPAERSAYLEEMTVRHLLTMTCGHAKDPTAAIRDHAENWVEAFLAEPVAFKPGTYFCYNSMGTYLISAIVQKVTGEKLADFLGPRLFEPLGIASPVWEESPQGIDCGGWGLYLKTEDMAKFGQLLLQGGLWKGSRLLPEGWIAEASSRQVDSRPAGTTPEQVLARGLTVENSDWLQGYGYQMWQCRHQGFRADGAYGQYIIVLPEKEAVIAMTAHVKYGMQKEIDQVWDILLPAL